LRHVVHMNSELGELFVVGGKEGRKVPGDQNPNMGGKMIMNDPNPKQSVMGGKFGVSIEIVAGLL